jgi:hypothetical protein
MTACPPLYPYPNGLLNPSTNLPWCAVGYRKQHLGVLGGPAPSVLDVLANPPAAMVAAQAEALSHLVVTDYPEP